MAKNRIAFYPGSFDPVTNGHVDQLREACRIADKVVVAIGVNPNKTPLFSVDERTELIREVAAPIEKETGSVVEVTTFSDLTVAAAARVGATMIIRGLRDGTDLDYEMQQAGMNAVMAPDIQTVFLPSSPLVRPITATLVRQIAAMGGDVSPFAPASVVARLKQKFPRP
ncbi:pantetheine-phosphate adenylyltransferase [Terrarubrum flagellatum]|uniref:pantetheine-phosphate adenylyltransferase n=1 Tax=Terrirubrum flagellatum TaxID=2895980 RepID=UPI0031456510